MLHEIRREYETDETRIVISGCIGPRGNGYNPKSFMTEAEAERYHGMQAEVFRDAEADMVTAITLGGCCGTDHRHVEEIVKACLTRS